MRTSQGIGNFFVAVCLSIALLLAGDALRQPLGKAARFELQTADCLER
jgi:hypothetical protein